MPNNLKEEYLYFKEHRQELIQQYPDKVLVIKDRAVNGVYDSEEQAVSETSKRFPLGTFIIQRCSTTEEEYVYSSRVAFA